MALICHHDIPLFFANIDTPGKQQKYSIALIKHLFSLLPPQANVIMLYDVGCVLSHSLDQYDILNSSITSCLHFAMPAMHAYGHEWACQLAYNPQLTARLGLSDGEGTEWLWSCFIKLIGIEQASLKGIAEQGGTAKADLASCDVPVAELQSQWAKQQEAQLSIWAHAPVRLRKELDSVLALQVDLDASEHTLLTPHSVIEQDLKDMSTRALDILDSMESSHTQLSDKLETLYALLNIQDKFPELDGTKLHQQTQKAIAKCQPALMVAIRRFNWYCEQLEELYDPAYAIPLPSLLPTKPTELCSDPTLLQDVWVTPTLGMEADNMCQWFSTEMCTVELALWQTESTFNTCPTYYFA
ncbi:hypothetical protein EDC04DRAFT_2869155 [Pisolithus marmoratus]|nr:hypothetical protein EDC04DRAFT_2869155 [Pisolithus marmoratus]